MQTLTFNLEDWQAATIERWSGMDSFKLPNITNRAFAWGHRSATLKAKRELLEAGYSEEQADMLSRSTMGLLRKQQYEKGGK